MNTTLRGKCPRSPKAPAATRLRGREKVFKHSHPRAFSTAVLAISLLVALIPTTSASAHVPEVRLSSSGTAVVDGVRSPGEWDTAARVDFEIILPAGGTTPATLYAMNDGTKLYLGVRIPGPHIGRGGIAFEFDNDHDGVREQGDNIALVTATEAGFTEGTLDGFRDHCGNPNPACGFRDADYGGTTDMVGAATNDGTAVFYEASVLLDTADDAHDFSLKVGDTVGFTIWATFLGPFPLFSHTFFPGHVAFPMEWGDITIASPDSTAPIISATTTPAPNAYGWNNTDVTATWSVSDPESGIASTSGCGATTLTQETSGTTLVCSAQNGVGLSSTKSLLIRIDKTAPTITFTGNAGTYTVDETIQIACGATDVLSGIAATSCPDVASGPATDYVGTTATTSWTRTATATDRAGNPATASTTFSVTVTADGICRLSASLPTADDICSKVTSIATAPNGAAKAGKFTAFESFLAAQSGKTIPANMADLLGRLAHLL